jgi:hypothetical protein
LKNELNKMEFVMKLKPALKLLCFFYIVLISGCNSNESVQEDNTPPVIDGYQTTSSVSFADDNSLISNVSITVNASDIDGSIVSYEWSLLSSQDIQLHDTEIATISFEVPLISSEDQNQIIIEATVTDNKQSQTSSTYEQDINDYLTVLISDIEVNSGEEGALIATVLGRESKISTLLWTVDSALEIPLLDAETKVVSFVAPDVNEVTEVTLMLEVTETDGNIFHHIGIVKIMPQ